ncbi:Rpn family recombination-promoting nuclease/putative transposase [Bacillus piscicola]|uniref:Rpn family recombination-promoting nuclease/putative transposase n=1 Tax=Bacillus piscicola TaxID=1632684 RepID=UPI0023DDD60D|nr:Rpn family recombination-promoting nuclease/putative transposase [Bacillus piscicola]
MDIKVYLYPQQLFGSEKNKEITVVFLNAILKRTRRDTIKKIMFLNQEYGGQYEADKQSRLDIVVRTLAGNLINVEMQLSNNNDMMKRTLYYWSRLYGSQLQRGKGYHTLSPTITINICDFTLFETAHYHTTYHLYEDSTMERSKRRTMC